METGRISERIGRKPRFTPSLAVTRLLAGEPSNHIFNNGRDFSVGLADLLVQDRVDSTGTRVRLTLATAASIQAAQDMMSYPLPVTSFLQLGDVIDPQILNDVRPLLEDTFKAARRCINSATDTKREESLFSQSLQLILPYLNASIEEATQAIKSGQLQQFGTLENLLPFYYELIVAKYVDLFHRLPTVQDFSYLARTSFGIVARAAAQDIPYMTAHNSNLIRKDRRNGFKTIPNADSLVLAQDGYTIRFRQTDEMLERVDFQYNTFKKNQIDSENNLITGCPANASLNPSGRERIPGFNQVVNIRFLERLTVAA